MCKSDISSSTASFEDVAFVLISKYSSKYFNTYLNINIHLIYICLNFMTKNKNYVLKPHCLLFGKNRGVQCLSNPPSTMFKRQTCRSYKDIQHLKACIIVSNIQLINKDTFLLTFFSSLRFLNIIT